TAASATRCWWRSCTAVRRDICGDPAAPPGRVRRSAPRSPHLGTATAPPALPEKPAAPIRSRPCRPYEANDGKARVPGSVRPGTHCSCAGGTGKVGFERNGKPDEDRDRGLGKRPEVPGWTVGRRPRAGPVPAGDAVRADRAERGEGRPAGRRR